MNSILEDAFLTASRGQGFQPSAEAMRRAAVDLAGSVMTPAGLIKMPGGYVISPADFASSLRHAAPELFSAIVQKSNDNPADRYTGMTAEMIALKDRSRRQILTDEERSRYTGKTREMMDLIAKARLRGETVR